MGPVGFKSYWHKTRIKQKEFPLANILKASIIQIPTENPITITVRCIFSLTHSVRHAGRSYGWPFI